MPGTTPIIQILMAKNITQSKAHVHVFDATEIVSTRKGVLKMVYNSIFTNFPDVLQLSPRCYNCPCPPCL